MRTAARAELQGQTFKAAAADPVSDWIEEIKQAWSRGGIQTVELARLVASARERMDYGEWSKLWKTGRMPFPKRKGEMLSANGERMGWVDAQMFACLPTSWSVLYQLAWVPREDFKKLIEQGVIHPNFTLREAEELAAPFRSRGKENKTQKGGVRRRRQGFPHFVGRTLGQRTPEERQMAKNVLQELIEEIDTNIGDLPEQLFADAGPAIHLTDGFPEAHRASPVFSTPN